MSESTKHGKPWSKVLTGNNEYTPRTSVAPALVSTLKKKIFGHRSARL